ncbi:hypothetical protein FCIRC_1263 [Fusarium circinatum]|uniref:F-box domain-containing protein n=1 Tax=Fusarium circinatum TaxID=48490 RepID=A0A8H5X6Z2_FUSCI|nr:hypothetical protein FCIRC_1263 [Fusarium circinatum]
MQKLKRLLQKRRLKKIDQAPTQIPTGTPPRSSSPPTVCLSTLEGLPFEIRNGILLAIDTIADLSALVHASPTFHQQYLLDRASLLWNCLQLELGNVLLDAYIADQCNMPEFRVKRSRQKVLLFIEEYKAQRLAVTEILSKPPEEHDTILDIATFHTTVVSPLVNHYVAWTRETMEGLSSPQETSKPERRRIFRGLYRSQIFYNLFGPPRGAISFMGKFGSTERLELFLNEYTAWEIEELLCIDRFMHSKYLGVFWQIQWDLHPDNPLFDPVRTGPHTPPGAYRLINDYPRGYQNGIISRGLQVASTLFELQDHSKKVEVVAHEIVSVVDDLLFDSTNPHLQEDRRMNHHSDSDLAQDNRETMSFSGDDEDSPPLAWVTFWKGRYSNLFGDFLPRSLRQWGYIMWDRNRLVNADALALIEQEWKTYYHRVNDEGEPEDPRDDIMTYT